MKLIFKIMICMAAAGTAAAQAQVPAPSRPPAAAAPATNQVNPILDGVYLKTEWHAVKNPFRIEETESSSGAPERTEQMEIVGLSRMPDEKGITRTYAFVTKTVSVRSDNPENPPSDPTSAAPSQEVHVLQAFPEILNESTTPTEDQAENSSITLLNSQLWFVGAVEISNKMNAVFWPSSTYPVHEESLQFYELTDPILKNLTIKETQQGEKIGGEKDANYLARLKKAKALRDAKGNMAAPGKMAPGKPTAMPGKPTVPAPITGWTFGGGATPGMTPKTGNVANDVRKTLQGP
jgi:hypothetical protein